MNSFFKDSHLLFKDVSKKIADKQIVSNLDTIQNTLLFALGVEKLLKGILYEINPILILEDPDFRNAFAVYYMDKLIAANSNTKDINSKPNADVIAFHNCVLRASLVCQSAHDFKNSLMKLKNYRDIIVHNSFDLLDYDEMKMLLNRDFYPILNAFSKELSWGEVNCFNNLHAKLALISSALQEDISKQIKLKLESKSASWKVAKGATGTIKRNKKLTVEMLQDEFAYPAKCPSCENMAVVFTTPVVDYNPFLKQEIQVGLDVKRLECGFCKLILEDYSELDFLKIVPEIDAKAATIEEYME